jgi:hypothetical protein
MSTLLDILLWILWLVWSIGFWVLSKLVWIAVWLVLPIAVLAFIALRIAEKVLGQEAVRAWVKAHSLKLGAGAWARVRRLLFALGVLPLRVLGWLAVYTIWHSLVSLLWRPKWSPWKRAWAKRWRARRA